MIRLRQFLESLRHALRGVVIVYQNEQSFRIQVFVSIAVLFFSFYYPISHFHFLLILLLIGAVLSLEIINSVFERIIDSFKPRIHPIVRDIKDIMAGAVLIVSLIAAVIGFAIFWPFLNP